ncbi:MAG: M14 family zinc carboxypeptidase [Chloroflexota bacterium]
MTWKVLPRIPPRDSSSRCTATASLVLWPWGGLYQPAPNYEGLKAIGDKLASFNGYQSCQPTDCLYAASGGSDDWAYGVLGIPAFTFEIGQSFMPPYREIDSQQWPENKPAFIYAARIARTPYQTITGPDSYGAASPVTGHLAFLEVTLDDSANGNHTIAGGEYSIDVPIWENPQETTPLVAADGAFDSETETAVATLNVSGLSTAVIWCTSGRG